MAKPTQTGALSAHSPRIFLGYRYIAVCLLVSVSGCLSSNPPEVHPVLATTPAAKIEITPSVLTVARPPIGTPEPTSFRLEALLWDAYDRIIPAVAGKDVTWSASGQPADATVILIEQDHSVIVEIEPFPGASQDITITAHVDGLASDPAVVTLVATLPTPDSDIVLSNHAAEQTSNIVMVDGFRTDGAGTVCLVDETAAFVHVGILGNLTGGCSSPVGELAVFSPDKGLFYQPVQIWVDDQEVDAGSPTPEFTKLPVMVWSAVHENGLTPEQLQDLQTRHGLLAALDVGLTNQILETNRVGIVLEMVGGLPKNIGGPTTAKACPVNENDVVADVLNIYVVTEMVGEGEYCKKRPGQPEEVILLDSARLSPSDMAHEIGHALALWTPGRWGHTDWIKGFRTNNAMWSFEQDDVAENRHHFSLGQAFRMNVDRESSLNHSVGMGAGGNIMVGTLARAATLPRIPCQCATYSDSPCPRLAKDLLSPHTELPPGERWRCADFIRLDETTDDNVVGMIRGRRWRSEATACEWVEGLPARDEAFKQGVLRLDFPNLGEPGCSDWDFAVFLTGHRMWYRSVPESTFKYYFKDDVKLKDVPEDQWIVPVVLWFEGGTAGYDAKDDKENASQVYGGVFDDGTSNRAGIKLTWTPNTGEPADWKGLKNALETALTGDCTFSDSHFVKDEINVYFLNQATDFDPVNSDFHFMKSDRGAACMDPAKGIYLIALAVPPSLDPSTTGLAHFLGHLFDLPEVAATDHTIMRHAPTIGVLGRGLGLTLGQVFRLNVDEDSWLNKSSESKRTEDALQLTEQCSLQTLDCPPVEMHITVP